MYKIYDYGNNDKPNDGFEIAQSPYRTQSTDIIEALSKMYVGRWFGWDDGRGFNKRVREK